MKTGVLTRNPSFRLTTFYYVDGSSRKRAHLSYQSYTLRPVRFGFLPMHRSEWLIFHPNWVMITYINLRILAKYTLIELSIIGYTVFL